MTHDSWMKYVTSIFSAMLLGKNALNLKVKNESHNASLPEANKLWIFDDYDPF